MTTQSEMSADLRCSIARERVWALLDKIGQEVIRASSRPQTWGAVADLEKTELELRQTHQYLASIREAQ